MQHGRSLQGVLGPLTWALSARRLAGVLTGYAPDFVRAYLIKLGNSGRVCAKAIFAVFVGLLGSVADVNAALVEVQLAFIEKAGFSITPTDTVSAAPGDDLLMEVSITNSVPLTFAVFSLRYDLDGDNELDIVSFELWAGVPLAGGDYFGPLGPMSVSATEVNTINGATSNFVLPRTLPAGTYVMATIRWLVTSNVNSDGPDVASGLFNVGTDGFADGMFVPITDLAFGSATVDSAADPTHTSTPTPTATPTGTPAPLCPASLDSTGCVAPGKAVVVLKDQSPDDKDKMVFKWLKGTTAVGDFGDPLGADAYELCLYDNGSRAMYANVAAGGTCAGEDCWKAIGNPTKGYIYKDAGAGSNGIAKIILKAGTGIGKVLVKGSGTALPLPAPVSPGTAFFNEPVTVQVRNAAGNCWQASFPTSKKNTGDSFTAKTP